MLGSHLGECVQLYAHHQVIDQRSPGRAGGLVSGYRWA
jgi:hypothetical protein